MSPTNGSDQINHMLLVFLLTVVKVAKNLMVLKLFCIMIEVHNCCSALCIFFFICDYCTILIKRMLPKGLKEMPCEKNIDTNEGQGASHVKLMYELMVLVITPESRNSGDFSVAYQ